MAMTKFPRYRNDTDGGLTVPGMKTLSAGESATTDDKKYLLRTDGLTLLQHRGAPWGALHGGTIGSGVALTDLAQYGQLMIVNLSGDTISLVANQDTDNPLVINDGVTLPIEQDREIMTIDISGSGSGTVYVYGLF